MNLHEFSYSKHLLNNGVKSIETDQYLVGWIFRDEYNLIIFLKIGNTLTPNYTGLGESGMLGVIYTLGEFNVY